MGQEGELVQAVIDIALQHGLVTEGTSMLVMRESQFEANQIDRRNRTRVEKETAARAQRSQQPVKSRDVGQGSGQSSPMFTVPRPSHGSGGAGSSDLLWILILLPLIWCRGRRAAGHTSN